MERAPYDGKEYSLKRLYLEYPNVKTVNEIMHSGTSTANFCLCCPEQKYCYIRRGGKQI
jgi:wobble nucleotide-excising tRNase